jgi:hypothetical protein
MGGDFCRSPESLNLSFSLCVWCAQLVFGSARGGGGMGTQGTISIQLDKQLANAEGTGEQIMRRVRVCARARQLPHSQPATKGGGPSHLILTHRLAVCVRACVRVCVHRCGHGVVRCCRAASAAAAAWGGTRAAAWARPRSSTDGIRVRGTQHGE